MNAKKRKEYLTKQSGDKLRLSGSILFVTCKNYA